MLGHWRFSFGFGVLGAVLTFLFQISRNTIVTTLTRSFYAFLVFACIMLVVRMLLDVLLKPAGYTPPRLPDADEENSSRIDLITPDDGGELADLMKEQRTGDQERKIGGFQPLNPTRLVSRDQPNTDEVVKAVRRMTDE